MASTKDIQDIMGMGGGPVQKPANKKKKKVVETQPRLSGISREVQALMGDSVPPVQIVETPKYKSKPSLASKLYKPRHWDERLFIPGARSDGLELRHWKRALPLQRPVSTSDHVDVVDGEKEIPKLEHHFEDEFPMDKWNIAVKIPEYSDEQYDKYYKAEDWSREETDYLMQLVAEYNLRWIVIADRYDPQDIPLPPTTIGTTDLIRTYAPRTTEQLKLRYYQIAAQDLELRTPKATMNPTEFALWEKMRNFDAKTEGLRKAMAEKLFERSKDEAEEERTLLEELHRITKNEEDFINMRRDLYARLEAAPSLRRNERGEEQNIVLSSAGISDLLSRLFAKEKHLKRRTLPNGEVASAGQQSSQDARARSNTQLSRRDTLETPTADSQKKAPISHPPVPKQLTKAEEERYGIVHTTERLTSGVSFRHEKINRITTAKSQVQTQKINAALTELEIPPRLSMPTEKVCKEFEKLVNQIQLLLDARKTLTRVSEEVKTLEEMRRQRLGQNAPKQDPANADAMRLDKSASSVNDSSVQHNSTTSKPAITSADRDGESVNGEPGPAIDEDDDDAEAEDDVDATKVDDTQNDDEEEEDEEDNDETGAIDDSRLQKHEVNNSDEEDDEDEEDEEEDEDEEDNEEEEDDDEGTAALRRGAENDDDEEEDDEEEEDEEEEHEALAEEEEDDEEDDEEEDDEPDSAHPKQKDADSDGEDDEDEDEEEEETQDVTMNEVEPADGDPDIDVEEVQESRPTSAGSRIHKRGASVISDASGAGSNRSAISRKRKR